MEKSTKYNGWTNYETWAVMLELVNDDYESYYKMIISQNLKDAEDTVKQYVWEYTYGS